MLNTGKYARQYWPAPGRVGRLTIFRGLSMLARKTINGGGADTTRLLSNHLTIVLPDIGHLL